MIFDDDGNFTDGYPSGAEPPEYTFCRFDTIAYETKKAFLVEVGWKKAWFPKDYCWPEGKIMSIPAWFKPKFEDL